MHILVTGANGQLGKSFYHLVNLNKINHQFVFASRVQLNLLNFKNVRKYIEKNKFDIILNCAAYTSVDKAENEKTEANLINNLAVKKIAEIAKSLNIKLIHISTDFVFDGLKNFPYLETDTTSPINIYGKTKLAGENAILSIMKFNAIIIRTSWVYSEYGNNFVDTILNLINNRNELNIVSDQIGSPTYVGDLAQVILSIIKSDNWLGLDRETEIYHFSNNGACSWYEFAKEIAHISGSKCSINPIKTEDYQLAAKRPKHVVLNKEKISKEFNLKLIFWKDSLKKCMKHIQEPSSFN